MPGAFEKMSFQTERPHPRSSRHVCFPRLLSISTIFVFLSVLSAALAYDMEVDIRAYDSRQFQKLERLGQIHVDQRQPPTVPARIQRRQDESSATSSAESVLSASTTPTSTSSDTASLSSPAKSSALQSESSTTSSATSASATVITTPLPVPFDTSLGSNFTSQSCPDFFNAFLSNDTFRSCSPVSLLLQNSNSFFRAEREVSLLSETLNIACDAPLAICTPLMTSLSQQLISTANCGDDYAQQNPLVLQAYNGFVAFEPIYRATCLKNPETGSYCFSDAIANASAPSDSYPYYTALGLNMPIGSRPTCNKCLQNTMNVFVGYATDSNQPLSMTYPATSYQIDLGCGANFVNTTVAAVSGAASSVRGANLSMLALALAAVAFIL